MPHPKEKRERAFAMFAEGKTYEDIAFELRIPAPTLRAWASRDKWSERKQIVAAAPDLDAATSQTVAKALAKSSSVDLETSDLELAEKQARYQAAMGDVALKIANEARTLEGDELFAKAGKLKDLDAIARKALKLESEKPTTVINVALLSHSTDKQPRLVSDSSAIHELTDAPPSQS